MGLGFPRRGCGWELRKGALRGRPRPLGKVLERGGWERRERQPGTVGLRDRVRSFRSQPVTPVGDVRRCLLAGGGFGPRSLPCGLERRRQPHARFQQRLSVFPCCRSFPAGGGGGDTKVQSPSQREAGRPWIRDLRHPSPASALLWERDTEGGSAGSAGSV